jgi:hypothetical protein
MQLKPHAVLLCDLLLLCAAAVCCPLQVALEERANAVTLTTWQVLRKPKQYDSCAAVCCPPPPRLQAALEEHAAAVTLANLAGFLYKTKET